MNEPRWYTNNDAVRLTGFCREQLVRFRRQGVLKSVKVGRAVRYRPEHIQEFIDRFKAEGDDPTSQTVEA